MLISLPFSIARVCLLIFGHSTLLSLSLCSLQYKHTHTYTGYLLSLPYIATPPPPYNHHLHSHCLISNSPSGVNSDVLPLKTHVHRVRHSSALGSAPGLGISPACLEVMLHRQDRLREERAARNSLASWLPLDPSSCPFKYGRSSW